MSQKSIANRTPYPWAELYYKWEHAQLNTEQLGGQLLVHGYQLHELVVACRRELERLNHAVEEMDARLQGLEGASFLDRLAD